MDRGKWDARISGHDRFGAIAVMRVEIPDRNPPHTAFKSIKGGHRGVVEITEPHGLIVHRVVSGRPHQTEGAASS
jgi:hypothetical protein